MEFAIRRAAQEAHRHAVAGSSPTSLPAAASIAPRQADAPLAGLLANLRILLIEDSPDPQRTCLTMLRQSGADVGLECNGRAAVMTALTAEPVFDVLVMDLAVPLDGMDAVRELRRQGFVTPILALTPSDVPGHQQIWRQAGCTACLTRPVSMPLLVAAILRAVSPDVAI